VFENYKSISVLHKISKKVRMKKIITLTLLLLSYQLAHTQKQMGVAGIDLDQMKVMKIRNIGPAGMSGRVTAIDVDMTKNIIYAGTASGGVWKSMGSGVKWEPIFDKEATQSIGSVAVNPKNGAEIWVGTGEGNPRNSQNSGEGIYKSIDGGRNWKMMGLKATRTLHRIVINTTNSDIVTVAALGSAFGPTEDRGIFQTKDGGKTWKKILYINDQTGCADLVVDPTNPNKMIAAMWEYGRKPWSFNSGGKGSGIYVTFDGGETWEKRTDKDGLPKGDIGRCGMTICKSKPNIIYAIVEAKENGIYKSTDGGFKWAKVGANGDRPFYYAEIYVDPKNENRLYNVYSRVSRSEDGARTWTELLSYSSVHPDHHAFWIDPENPNHLIDGNDGGLNISYDMGASWQFATNLPVGQFYHVNVDNEIPYNLYGGLQDNGTWVGPSAVWKFSGIRNSDWQEVMFGDGFDAMPRKDNSRYGFAMSQGGSLGYFDKKTGVTQYIRPAHPTGEKLRFNWNAALAQNPFADCGIYYGSQFVHKSMDCGQSWEIISPDLTTNDTAKIHASEISGGLTPDVTAAENHCTILVIAPSPKDPKVIWASTDDGNVQITKDAGKTWEKLNINGCPKNAWIPQIEVSQSNPAEAFLVVNNYRQNDWKPYSYHTTDYGKTWTRIADENQIGAFCLSITQDAVEPNLLFLGTDNGLYISINGGNIWQKWKNDFPSVPVYDMKIHPRDGDLVIATFGRAFWILDDIRPLREIAHTNGEILKQEFRVFPTQDAYLANFRSVDGERFAADAIYEGQNKSPICVLNVWNKTKPEVKKDDKTDDKKASPQAAGRRRGGGANSGKPDGSKVKVQIFDETGDSIRTFTSSIDTGLNKIYWWLERKGVNTPSERDAKEDEEPGGTRVLPGTYKIVLTLGERKDSTSIVVHPDPRLDISAADTKAKDAAQRDLEKLIEKATLSFNRLKEAEKTISLIDGQLGNAVDSVKTDIAKSGKALKDSIAILKKRYMLPSDTKGINRSPNALTDIIGEAENYLYGSQGKPNGTIILVIDKAKKRTAEIIEQVNTFFSTDWAKYQAKVEAVKYSLFKEYKPIKIDN
jgi:photosystem II stability/assembly factor-like uncharacterized protein